MRYTLGAPTNVVAVTAALLLLVLLLCTTAQSPVAAAGDVPAAAAPGSAAQPVVKVKRGLQWTSKSFGLGAAGNMWRRPDDAVSSAMRFLKHYINKDLGEIRGSAGVSRRGRYYSQQP